MAKEILITGSEGFVGRHLSNELGSHGYEISGTSLADTNEKNIYQCDITDPEALSLLVDKLRPEAIFHLAAFVKPAKSTLNPDLVFKINVEGTRNLFEAVRTIPDYRP